MYRCTDFNLIMYMTRVLSLYW